MLLLLLLLPPPGLRLCCHHYNDPLRFQPPQGELVLPTWEKPSSDSPAEGTLLGLPKAKPHPWDLFTFEPRCVCDCLIGSQWSSIQR